MLGTEASPVRYDFPDQQCRGIRKQRDAGYRKRAEERVKVVSTRFRGGQTVQELVIVLRVTRVQFVSGLVRHELVDDEQAYAASC